MKKIIVLTLFLLVIFSVFFILSREVTPSKSESAVTLLGSVENNDKSCTADGACILTVETPNGIYNVYYGTGWTPCENWKKNQDIFKYQEGEMVEIYGLKSGRMTIDVCSSLDYYVIRR